MQEGPRQEEKVGGGGADHKGQNRWRAQQLERDKLDRTAAHNHEVSGLRAVLTGLRADLERGEVERQSLEYQLALSHRQTDREEERSSALSAQNNTLREHVLQLEQRVSEVEGSLHAREQDQHALRQEVGEAEGLKKKAQAQTQRLTQDTQRLHTLLKDKEEALQEVKRKMQEAEGEREEKNDALRETTAKLHLLQGRAEESRRQEERWMLRIRCLESNIEAERASNIEAKVRVQSLEEAAAVARSGQQEALSDLQLLRSQFREVEQAMTTTHTVDLLEKQYQQFKSDLSVALETQRKATSDLVDRLEEEKREHSHTHSLLEQSKKKQVYLQEVYVSCTMQIRTTLEQHSNTGRCVVAQQEVNDKSSAEVLEQLAETLNNYRRNLDTATQQVQNLLGASEKLDGENVALRALISDQSQHIQELETILFTEKQEVMRLHKEISDWSKWSTDLKGQLEQSRLALEREREEWKMEGEREKAERKMEVQKITDLYHEETKKSLSFLYSLYQHLLVGCEPPQSIMGNFTWAELCDVINQRVNSLTLELSHANDKLSVCVGELQKSQECVSRLEDGKGRQDELCLSLQQQLSCCQLQCLSLTSDLREVQAVLEGERRAGAGLLAACALLAGVLLECRRRCASLRHQKEVLLRRGPREEARGRLEEEVGRLASALGGEEEEEEERKGRGQRRWRVCTCALLALNRMRARAAAARLCVRWDGLPGALRVRLPPHLATPTPDRDQEEDDDDGGRGEEEPGSMCVNWLRSKRLSALLRYSMSGLQDLLSHAGPSNQELESAAHSGLCNLLDALLHQSDDMRPVTKTPELSLAGRLGRGLARLQATPQHSSRGVVEKLQQHFLVFSKRLHTAEVERRALRLEVANQKQAAKGHQELVPPERFNSVCEELRAALSREEQLQTLLKKQYAQNHTHNQCRQELRRKDQALRILGKHLSGMQREKRALEEPHSTY